MESNQPTHQHWKDRLGFLGDPEQDPQEKADLLEHISTCAECSEEVAKLSLSQQAFQSMPPTSESDFFVHQTMQQIDREVVSHQAPSALGWLRWLSLPEWVPALATGVATLAICFSLNGQTEAVSTESLLLSQVSGSDSWIFSTSEPASDFLLSVSME